MKNLKLLSLHHRLIGQADCYCLGNDGTVYFASNSGIFFLDNVSDKVCVLAELCEDAKDTSHHLIGIEYIFEADSIFLVFSSGRMFLYDLYKKMFHCTGLVTCQLVGYAWSPDQELLVLLTGANALILLTKCFEAITEKSLNCDEFGESKPISVGWGSKETQFHGSEGKEAARPKQIEAKPALPYDDHRPRINWREDGEYFATSSIDNLQGCRLLRIWNRNGILQYTSEVKNGLEEPLSWKPSGSCIACSQQDENKHKIIFFEKNGLQHGQFILPFKPNMFKVTSLLWNQDASILLVIAQELVESPSYCKVMLYTCSNYHWYLKQSFQLNPDLIAQWDVNKPRKLHYYNKKSGDFYSIEWAWTIFQNPYLNGCDDAIIGSIHNDNIFVTPFAKLVVPPPMSAYMYTLSSAVQSMFFSPNAPAFSVYLGDYKLAFFQKGSNKSVTSKDCKFEFTAAGGNGFKTKVQPYSFCGIYNIKIGSLDAHPYGLCHWTWTKGNRLLCICYSKCNENSNCVILSLQLPQICLSETEELVPNVLVNLENSVFGICSNINGSVIAVQMNDGKVLHLNLDEASNSLDSKNLLSPWLCDDEKNLVFPQPCTNMSIISIHDKEYILGLNERYNLFCNDYLILSNCTSYSIHNEFLLVTTTDNMLKCFSKDWDLPALLKNKPEALTDVSSQRIEKSTIVTSPHGSTKVILQMPRGNLETIHPRPLILSHVCKHLNKLHYKEAFELSKVHRIDLNLLFDYNPKEFLENVEKVIEQIGSPSNLNLFLANLKNEDVCIIMYPLVLRKKQKTEIPPSLDNKIVVVCDAFRKYLEGKNDKKFFQTLMATYAKKGETEEALLRLQLLKDTNKDESTQALVDNALNFLLYLVDVNELIDIALGTYNLETALMVSQKSQKDPKEFLEFYNNLLKMEENYRKYKIDMHLKRYKKALEHISKCEDHFAEFLALIKSQRLYSDALHLFPNTHPHRKLIWKEYGKYLMEKRYFDEAGLAFICCCEHERALLAYKESLNWQSMLQCAVNLNYSDDKVITLCQEISERLKSNHKYLDAAYLLEHYVKDIEESVVTLIEGCEWNSALFIMSKYRRKDIAETHLKPALLEHHAYLNIHLDRLSKDFCMHNERLKFLRNQKQQQSELPDFARNREDDLFSETSSIVDDASYAESKSITGSIMTKKSSKSRRKQELKKYRLKEGSPNEDLAHIAALSEIIIKIDTLKDSFSDTLKNLVQFGYEDQAKSLQTQMCILIKEIEFEIPNIWCRPGNLDSSSDLKFGPDSTANSIAASLYQEQKNSVSDITDPALAAPQWRNIDVTLQMLR